MAAIHGNTVATAEDLQNQDRIATMWRNTHSCGQFTVSNYFLLKISRRVFWNFRV